MSETDVEDWLTGAGYRRDDGAWIVPGSFDENLHDLVFAEYERRTGYPLSVTRGRTGSMGPLFAALVVDLLGRGHPEDYQKRIVTALLDAVIESGYWPTAFSVVRDEFEATPC